MPVAIMLDLEAVKAQIQSAYDSAAPIRINVSIRRPRIELENVSVKVVGVYPHIFRIETEEKENYSLQYTDVLVGKIELLS